MPNWKKVIVQGSDATLNTVTASNGINALESGFTVEESTDTELEVQGTITASGHLFASLSFDSAPDSDGVVVYDTANGQLYFTGSYGGAGGGSGVGQFDTISAVVPGNPDDSQGIAVEDNIVLQFSGSGNITCSISDVGNAVVVGIDGSNIDDDWLISGIPNAGLSFVSSSRAVLIGPSGSTELKPGGNATHNLSLGVHGFENDPNHLDANGTATLGRGLSSSVDNETIVGRFNDDSFADKLFSIGNGHAFNDRRNIALYRSRSIDFSPDGLVLEDYFIQSEGGNLTPITPTVTVPDEEFTIEFIFSDYSTGVGVSADFTNTGNANLIGNLFGFTALQTAIDNKINQIGGGAGQLTQLHLTELKVIGDYDSSANEDLRNVIVGGESILELYNQNASNDSIDDFFMTVWTGSLSALSQYFGGSDTITSMEGVSNTNGYTLGQGNPLSIQAGHSTGNSPGISFQASFGDGVNTYGGTTSLLSGVSTGGDPSFQFTFIVPGYTYSLPDEVSFPKGVGLFVGEERLRPGGTLSTTLGNENHGVVITNINTESSDDETSGLRIIVGDHNDNDGLGIDLGSSTSTSGVGMNNFITFDAKNASETYGYERMGYIACASGQGQPLLIFSQSDKRLKENIKLTKKGISLIKDIKVRDFNWKNSPSNTVTGFVAQELYKVIPEAVKKGGTNPKTNPWTVNYQVLIPYMIKAIQEQQKLIENLQKQIDQLK